MPTHGYSHQCYKMFHSSDGAEGIACAFVVRTLLFEHGSGYMWEATTVEIQLE